jgi:hypothetical protein
MDQVRVFLKLLVKYHFWILSVLVLIIATVCWTMASSSLDAKFTQRKSAIDSAFSSMTTLKQQATCPNPEVNKVNQERVDEQTKIVLDVWKGLYQRQRDEVLKWPQELGSQFIEYIETRKFRDSISNEMRTLYQNYIEKRFDGLLDIVKAQKMDAGAGGYTGGLGEGGRGGYERGFEGGPPMGQLPGVGVPGEEQNYLVQWLDQNNLRAKLDFTAAKPTSIQVWVTQEDLWVYETLLNVMANTNKARKATRPDNTAVRAIIALEVGRATATSSMGSSGQVLMPQGTGGGGMRGEGESMGGEMGGEMGGGRMEYTEGGTDFGGGRGEMYGGEMGMGMGMGGEADDATVLAGRYLDETGQPLADASGSLGVEYRQLPIYMSLIMDQRWIPHLLIECANAALPIEVKQVRMNPGQGAQGYEQGGGYGGTTTSVQGLEADPSMAQVEIKGVVFIYNEPDANLIAPAPAAEDQTAALQP